MRYALWALFLTVAPGGGHAHQAADLAALDAQLPGTLINDPTRLDWPLSGAAERRTIRSATIPGGGAAMRIAVKQTPANVYDVQVKAPITGALRRGDDVVVAIQMRAASARTPDGQGKVALRVQQDSAPYPGFADAVVAIGGEWRLHEVAGKADRDYPAGAAVVSIQLGGAVQTIEIGQAIVVKGATSLAGAAPAAESAPTPAPVALPRQLQGLGATINDPANRDWAVYGTRITHEPVAAAVTGRVATRVVVPTRQPNRWDAGVNAPIAGAVKQGQALRVAFIARTVASEAADGRGAVTIRLQSNKPPYDGFGDNDVAVGTDWQLIQLKTVADRALPAGHGVVALHLGGAAQTLEIGPIWVIETTP